MNAQAFIAFESFGELIADRGVSRSIKIDKEDRAVKRGRKEAGAFADEVRHRPGPSRGGEGKEKAAFRLHGVDPKTSAMFEDLARNLVVPHQLGMTTVLVVPDGTEEVVREDWELEGRDAAHVDHVTDDLTGFLQKLA